MGTFSTVEKRLVLHYTYTVKTNKKKGRLNMHINKGFVLAAIAAAHVIVTQPCGAATVFDFSNTDGFDIKNYCNYLSIDTRDHGGSGAFVFRNEREKQCDTYWSLATPYFPVKVGKMFAVKVRTMSDIGLKATKPISAVLWYAADGKPLLAQDVLGQDSQVTTPMPIRTSATAYRDSVMAGVVPDGAAFASVRICADNPNLKSGQSVAISHIEYIEREDGAPWPYDDLTPPKVERITPSPNADLSTSVTFRISDPSGIGKVAISLDGTDITERVVFEGAVATYKPSVSWAEDSIHEFVFSVEDNRGNDGCVSQFICFTRNKVMHEKVTIRDDGVILCGGSPFFPIGMWAVCPQPINENNLDRAVKDLKEAGCNVLQTYARFNDKLAQGLVSACNRENIKVLLEPGLRKGTKEICDKVIRSAVFAGRSHPSVFSWCIGDDTSCHRTPEELARDYDLLHAVDPNAIASHADGSSVNGTLAGFAPWTDMFLCELYPMRNEKPELDALAKMQRHIGIAYSDLRAGGAPAPCVVAILQAFSGWEAWKRYPTPEEIRAMTFLAIACRVRGISYYTYVSKPSCYGVSSTPERFDALSRITREVSLLSPHLVTRDATVQPTVTITDGPQKAAFGFSSVTALLKESGLLIAVNIAPEQVKAVLSLPDGRRQEVSLARNGVFVGQFAQPKKLGGR